jgi:hypothetical protein
MATNTVANIVAYPSFILLFGEYTKSIKVHMENMPKEFCHIFPMRQQTCAKAISCYCPFRNQLVKLLNSNVISKSTTSVYYKFYRTAPLAEFMNNFQKLALVE